MSARKRIDITLGYERALLSFGVYVCGTRARFDMQRVEPGDCSSKGVRTSCGSAVVLFGYEDNRDRVQEESRADTYVAELRRLQSGDSHHSDDELLVLGDSDIITEVGQRPAPVARAVIPQSADRHSALSDLTSSQLDGQLSSLPDSVRLLLAEAAEPEAQIQVPELVVPPLLRPGCYIESLYALSPAEQLVVSPIVTAGCICRNARFGYRFSGKAVHFPLKTPLMLTQFPSLDIPMYVVRSESYLGKATVFRPRRVFQFLRLLQVYPAFSTTAEFEWDQPLMSEWSKDVRAAIDLRNATSEEISSNQGRWHEIDDWARESISKRVVSNWLAQDTDLVAWITAETGGKSVSDIWSKLKKYEDQEQYTTGPNHLNIECLSRFLQRDAAKPPPQQLSGEESLLIRILRELDGAFGEMNLGFPQSEQQPLNIEKMEEARPVAENKRHFLQMSFPYLFPLGLGDRSSFAWDGPCDAYVDMLLHRKEGTWGNCRRFKFMLFNWRRKLAALRVVGSILKRPPAAESGAEATQSDLFAAKVDLLSGRTPEAAANLAEWVCGSGSRRPTELHRIQQLTENFGGAHAFITKSFADMQCKELHWVLLLKDRVSHSPVLLDFHGSELDLSTKQVSLLVSQYPELANHWFRHETDTFFRCLLNPLFGVRVHYTVVEWQIRGTPHIHCLVWLDGLPSWSFLLRESSEIALEIMNLITSAVLPSCSHLTSHEATALYKKTIHTCDPTTLRLGSVLKAGARAGWVTEDLLAADTTALRIRSYTHRCGSGCLRRGVCRHGAPWHVLDTGTVVQTERGLEHLPQRTGSYQVKSNDLIVTATRQNTEVTITVVQSSIDFYLSFYLSKGEKSDDFAQYLRSLITTYQFDASKHQLFNRVYLNGVSRRLLTEYELCWHLSGMSVSATSSNVDIAPVSLHDSVFIMGSRQLSSNWHKWLLSDPRKEDERSFEEYIISCAPRTKLPYFYTKRHSTPVLLTKARLADELEVEIGDERLLSLYVYLVRRLANHAEASMIFSHSRALETPVVTSSGPEMSAPWSSNTEAKVWALDYIMGALLADNPERLSDGYHRCLAFCKRLTIRGADASETSFRPCWGSHHIPPHLNPTLDPGLLSRFPLCADLRLDYAACPESVPGPAEIEDVSLPYAHTTEFSEELPDAPADGDEDAFEESTRNYSNFLTQRRPISSSFDLASAGQGTTASVADFVTMKKGQILTFDFHRYLAATSYDDCSLCSNKRLLSHLVKQRRARGSYSSRIPDNFDPAPELIELSGVSSVYEERILAHARRVQECRRASLPDPPARIDVLCGGAGCGKTTCVVNVKRKVDLMFGQEAFFTCSPSGYQGLIVKGTTSHRLLHVALQYPRRTTDARDTDNTLNGEFIDDEALNLARGDTRNGLVVFGLIDEFGQKGWDFLRFALIRSGLIHNSSVSWTLVFDALQLPGAGRVEHRVEALIAFLIREQDPVALWVVDTFFSARARAMIGRHNNPHLAFAGKTSMSFLRLTTNYRQPCLIDPSRPCYVRYPPSHDFLPRWIDSQFSLPQLPANLCSHCRFLLELQNLRYGICGDAQASYWWQFCNDNRCMTVLDKAKFSQAQHIVSNHDESATATSRRITRERIADRFIETSLKLSKPHFPLHHVYTPPKTLAMTAEELRGTYERLARRTKQYCFGMRVEITENGNARDPAIFNKLQGTLVGASWSDDAVTAAPPRVAPESFSSLPMPLYLLVDIPAYTGTQALPNSSVVVLERLSRPPTEEDRLPVGRRGTITYFPLRRSQGGVIHGLQGADYEVATVHLNTLPSDEHSVATMMTKLTRLKKSAGLHMVFTDEWGSAVRDYSLFRARWLLCSKNKEDCFLARIAWEEYLDKMMIYGMSPAEYRKFGSEKNRSLRTWDQWTRRCAIPILESQKIIDAKTSTKSTKRQKHPSASSSETNMFTPASKHFRQHL